jgi:hypothetical protein
MRQWHHYLFIYLFLKKITSRCKHPLSVLPRSEIHIYPQICFSFSSNKQIRSDFNSVICQRGLIIFLLLLPCPSRTRRERNKTRPFLFRFLLLPFPVYLFSLGLCLVLNLGCQIYCSISFVFDNNCSTVD